MRSTTNNIYNKYGKRLKAEYQKRLLPRQCGAEFYHICSAQQVAARGQTFTRQCSSEKRKDTSKQAL